VFCIHKYNFISTFPNCIPVKPYGDCVAFMYRIGRAPSIPSENSQCEKGIKVTITITRNMTGGKHTVGNGCGIIFLQQGC